jgi:hypothetical protein
MVWSNGVEWGEMSLEWQQRGKGEVERASERARTLSARMGEHIMFLTHAARLLLLQPSPSLMPVCGSGGTLVFQILRRLRETPRYGIRIPVRIGEGDSKK